MKTIELKIPDWRQIRIALSLSLMKREPVLVKGGFEFIERNFDLVPLYNDLKRLVSLTGSGIFAEQDGDIIFYPEGLCDGTYDFETDKFSSISEMELFLLPSLFYQEFRSVINYTGVTHCHLSYPTVFIKETFFSLLESTGHYASLNMKRFGFYGSGGGLAVSRIYPAEPKSCGGIFSFEDPKIDGVRIFMAKMNMEMAGREKEFIIKNTGLDENRVQIMEIVDADGYGNSIHVYVNCGGVNIILSRDMELYNSAGDFVFDENRYYTAVTGLIQDTERLVKLKKPPVYLGDELLPYLFLSGSDIPDELKTSHCYGVCSQLL